jgi:hypothetical protein
MVAGDVSCLKLVRARMAKSVLDSGYGHALGFPGVQGPAGCQGIRSRQRAIHQRHLFHLRKPDGSAKGQWVDSNVATAVSLISMALEIVRADRFAVVTPISGGSPVIHQTQVSQELLESGIRTQGLEDRIPDVSGVVA